MGYLQILTRKFLRMILCGDPAIVALSTVLGLIISTLDLLALSDAKGEKIPKPLRFLETLSRSDLTL
jgi:hypothetical protein